ncbi:hypothetical protein H8E77_04100, partial [bacterium]|nr:hypothetical protein [bacterium]
MTAMKKLRPSIFLWIHIVCFSIVFLSASPLFAKKVIVAIGDSITQGDTQFTLLEHRNTIQGGWVTRLRNRLQEYFPDEYEVINRGINGDNVQGVLNRLNRDVISKQPSIVIIGIGTNDTYGGSIGAPPSTTSDAYR